MSLYSINVPEGLYRRLKKQADAQKRSLDELVQQALSRQLPSPVAIEDDLPPLLREELSAMAHLSDVSLWQLAKSTLSPEQLEQIDQFQAIKNKRSLSPDESSQYETLLRDYDETILRRAHAAMLLNERGFDLSDPSVLAES